MKPTISLSFKFDLREVMSGWGGVEGGVEESVD